jgi:YesN/AraC family two-component response regulator
VTNTELEKVAVLLCYDTYDEAEAEKVEATIRYIQEDIEANCGLTVCVGISEVVPELLQVHSCYAHALQAVDYKSIHGKNALIYYERLTFSAESSLPRLSKEIHDIHDYLRDGDVERIKSCLGTVFEDLLKQQPVSQDWIHAVFANILSVIMKYVIEHRIELHQYMKEDVFITLYSYEFLEDKQEYILSICSKIIEIMHTPKEETNSTASQIMDYIDKHFDQPISLNILADKLAMSPSYLSVLIKNYVGVGFVEYVSKLRIQKAMKLLENDKMTIQDIAEQCGYDTVHTFIRQFKKVYSIPPNEYRSRKRSDELKNRPG